MGLFGLSQKEKGVWKTIQPEDVIKIRIKDNPQEKYFSKVVSLDEASLAVETPIIGTTFLELPKDLTVELEIFTPDGGRIKLSTKVISQEWTKERIITFAAPRSLERIQLRAFYRLDVVMDVEYCTFDSVSSAPRGLEMKHPVLLGLTKDISEGGAFLLVDKMLVKNKIMNLKIKLPDKQVLRARAKALRLEETGMRGKYAVGVEFMYMSEEDREILRRFIFLRSRERYKNFKGRG